MLGCRTGKGHLARLGVVELYFWIKVLDTVEKLSPFAVREIEGRYGERGEMDFGGWELLSPDKSIGQDGPEGYTPGGTAKGSYSPFDCEAAKALEEARAGLDEMTLKQSALKTGTEGAVAKNESKVRGGETLGVRGEGAKQKCQYRALSCAGCGVHFELGETMQSCCGELVHPTEACVRATEKKHGEKVVAGASPDPNKAGPTLHVVYSSLPGQSGFFADAEAASEALVRALEADAFTASKEVIGEEAARAFLKEANTAAAIASLPKSAGVDVARDAKDEELRFYWLPRFGVFKGRFRADGIGRKMKALDKSDFERLRSGPSLGNLLDQVKEQWLDEVDGMWAGEERPAATSELWMTDMKFQGPVSHPGLEIGQRIPSHLLMQVGRLENASQEAMPKSERLPEHACVLMMGWSEKYEESVTLLGKLRGRNKWVPFGGLREVNDVDGAHMALREMMEEFMGYEGYIASQAGRQLEMEANRNGAIHGPFGRPPAGYPHAAYILEVDKMGSMQHMDRFETLFKPNAECSDVRMVRVSELGSGHGMEVLDVHGETLPLRDRLGVMRVERMKAMAMYSMPRAMSFEPSQSSSEGTLTGEALTARDLVLKPEVKGSQTRRVHLAEKLAPARLIKICECIEGRCGIEKTVANATKCKRGCGRSLHVETCAQMGKGYAALGNFMCVDCRLRDSAGPILSQASVLKDAFSPTGPLEDDVRVRELTLRAMVLDLGQGEEATAAGYAEFTRLEEDYAKGMGMTLDKGESNGGLCMPRHSKGAFKNFLIWLSIDDERARSLDSVFRSAGAMMTKLQLKDHTKAGDVKALYKDLVKEVGIEHEPSDTATPRMLKVSVETGGVIDARYSKAECIAKRTKANLVIEGVGACRIGEVAGGGDAHGLLANEKDSSDPMHAVVEGYLEHSKTGFSRYFDMVGKTENSGIEVAKIIEDYWGAAGFTITETWSSGIKVRRPDFLVVRVSLLGMDEADVARLVNWARTSKYSSVVKHAESTRTYAMQRHAAAGSGSQAKKYVNVAGGNSRDVDMPKIVAELKAMGFTANVTAGPFLLATRGGVHTKFTLMSLTVSSVSGVVKSILESAYELANADPQDPNPDLELTGKRKPKVSTHSLRRMANTNARRYREVTDTTEADIDLYFGWNERVLLKEMQVHYAKMTIRERMEKAKVTSKI